MKNSNQVLKPRQHQIDFGAQNAFKDFFLRHTSDAVLISESFFGQILFANDRALKILGQNESEILLLSVNDLLDEGDLRLENARAKLDQLGYFEGELLLKRIGDKSFAAKIRCHLVLDENGELIQITFINDLSLIKSLQDQLHKSTRLLEQTGRIANVGGWEYNIINDKLTWTSVSRKILEVDVDFIPSISKALNFYNKGYDRDTINTLVKSAIEDGKPFDIVLQITTAKGKLKWVRSLGQAEIRNLKIVRIFGAIQDLTELMLKDEQLKESLSRFTSFAENAPFSFCIYGVDGTISYANDYYHNLLNLKHGEITGKSVEDIFEIGIANQIRKTNTEVFESDKPISLEDDNLINGKVFHFYTTKFPIKNAKGKNTAIGSVSIDVGERKRQEKELLLRERRMSSLLDSSSYFLIRIDLQGRFTYVNKAYTNVYGINNNEHKGEVSTLNIHQEDIKYAIEAVRECIKSAGKIVTIQLREFNKNKELIHTRWEFVAITDFSGFVYELQGVGWDISSLVAQQKEISKLALVAEKTKNAVVITDASGLIEWVNDGFFRLTEYTLAEVLGKKPSDLLQGKETDMEVVEFMANSLKSKQGVNVELINYTKSKRKYWVKIEIEPIFNDLGELTKFIAIESDITEKKEQEILQKHLVDDLMLKNKNLEEFSYILSHNLRGPVSNILGLINIFSLSNPDATNLFIIDSLNKATTQLDDVISDVNKIISIRKNLDESETFINLHDFIEDIINSFGIELSKIDHLIQNKIPKSFNLFSIRGYLQSIFYNLVNNAIKYRKSDGQFQLTIEAKVFEGNIQISIIDNGIGIDLDLYGNKVFMLYKRFHTHLQGKGMGLFMTKQQVELLGGNIKIESKPSVGTTFLITLPTNKLLEKT